ncbi:hypothetical protein DF196_02150 [Bifidobacterium callitrichidarum]|uniref:Uncharacterized protein n=1 Tax=Bifidobacterium callitrichidarum TaxID=2052941 RepID=A0A2U2NC44_9BIFI|nr:hypothetical protein DF196_02150 [Bifidobacterium callitrichidarum]
MRICLLLPLFENAYDHLSIIIIIFFEFLRSTSSEIFASPCRQVADVVLPFHECRFRFSEIERNGFRTWFSLRFDFSVRLFLVRLGSRFVEILFHCVMLFSMMFVHTLSWTIPVFLSFQFFVFPEW